MITCPQVFLSYVGPSTHAIMENKWARESGPRKGSKRKEAPCGYACSMFMIANGHELRKQQTNIRNRESRSECMSNKLLSLVRVILVLSLSWNLED